MVSEYLQIRKIESAKGKTHEYQASFYALHLPTGDIIFKSTKSLKISQTSVRLRENTNTWEVQEQGGGCGWHELTSKVASSINSVVLNELIKQ